MARLGGRPTSPPASTIARTPSPAAAQVQGSNYERRRERRRPGVEQISEAEGVHAAGPSSQQSPMHGGPPIMQPRSVRASSRLAVAPRSHPIAASCSLGSVRRCLRGSQSASALHASVRRSTPCARAALVFHVHVAMPVRTTADRPTIVTLCPSRRATVGQTTGPPYLISSASSATAWGRHVHQ
jgi:hypothetical protein